MYSALYFPKMGIESEAILKTALLLWDDISYIYPYKDNGYYGPPELEEAHSLVTSRYVPTEADKATAHEAILDLATSDTPELFFRTDLPEASRYDIYPQKFLPETWHALIETGFAKAATDSGDSIYSLAPAMGITMMSVLAEICAGTERRTITDSPLAHYVGNTALSGLSGGKPCNINSPVERLVMLSLEVVDAKAIPLSKLVDFRKREEGSSEGQKIRALRRSYVKK
jgi:hypothetical protein